MMTESEDQRPTTDPDDPLGPPPAAMFDDDPLGPPPAAMFDAPRPPEAPHPAPAEPGPSGDSRTLAAISHLSAFVAFAGVPSFIGPLVVWLLQKDRDPFVAEEAREALNFNLSLLIYAAAAIVAMIFTLGLGLIVIVPVALVAFPAWLVLTVLAAVRSADGTPYRYPLTLRLVN